MTRFLGGTGTSWHAVATALTMYSGWVYANDDVVNSPLADETTSISFGAGAERTPKWLGSANYKTRAIPYFDISWHDRIELSATDGLTVDLVHQAPWHAGVIGTMMWGRSGKDLGPLSAAVPTLNNTIQGGIYIEYSIDKVVSLGLRMRHDMQQTGASYGDAYAELALPAPWPVEHSLKINFGFMNHSAMQRHFGLSSESAATLDVSPYKPRAGMESTTLTYQIFVPTSAATGIVAGANWGLLANRAGNSPLVRRFGSREQRELMAAFVVHF